MVDCASTVSFTLRELLVYFLRLGTLGFGGPIALAGHMQKDLVEERRWVSKQDYLEGLAFSQLSPGPLAAQLAMYLGWLRAGTIGATLVGIAFILPSFLMVLVLAALYVHFGSLPWIQGMFYGIGAAVIAIIVRSAIKLVRGTVGRDWLLWAIFTALAITTAWTKSEIVYLGNVCWRSRSAADRDSRSGVNRNRRGPVSFFLEGWRFRIRQWVGNCSVLVWRGCSKVPLAH